MGKLRADQGRSGLESVGDAARRIAGASSRQAVAAAVVAEAERLIGARCAFEVEHAADRAQPSELRALAERAMASGAPLSATSRAGATLAAAPLALGGQAVAALVAQGELGERELQLLTLVAQLGACALAAIDSAERARRAEAELARARAALVEAQETERRRLGLALHDGAGQLLGAMQLQLGALADELHGRRAGAKVDTLRGLVERTLGDLRSLSHDLRPAALQRLGLVAALDDLAASCSAPALEVTVHADRDADLDLPPAVALALFRIAQAALGNVLRHAGAHKAELRLFKRRSALAFEIADDGRGFDPAAAENARGLGLSGMRERAACIGAELRVDAAAGAGTRVRVEWAWPSRAACDAA